MNETVKNVKRTYHYAKKYKKHLIGFTFATIGGAIIGIILPLLVAKQIVYLTSSTWEQLIIISLVILAVDCYSAFAAMFFHRRNSNRLVRKTMKDLQFDLGKSVLKISQKDIDSNSSGMFIQRVTNDAETISSFFFDVLNNLRTLLANVGALIATLFISWKVFLYYLFVTIILVYFHLIRAKKKGKKDAEFRKKTDEVSGLVGELVRGSRDIKMLNARKSFMTTLNNNVEIQNQKRFEMSNINAFYTYVIEALTAIFEFGLVILLIFLIKNNSLSVAMAIVLFNYGSEIMTNLMAKISTLLDCIKSFNISFNRCFSILDDTEFTKETFGNKHLEDVKGNFEFKDVSFSYDKQRIVLDNISFKINSGEMVGFVGKSGVILSGGQKQRLAIARAFVQKTKIILFDEATSALDNETQGKIQSAISVLKNEYKYTILIIAHRLSTIVNCDKIMILNNGKIESSGSHTELLENNIIYQSLYNTEIIK